MNPLFLWLLLACGASVPGPAPAGTPAAMAASRVSALVEGAKQVERLALEVEAVCDPEGRTVPLSAVELVQIRARVEQMQERAAALDAALQAVEQVSRAPGQQVGREAP